MYKYGPFDERMIGTHERERFAFQDDVAQIEQPPGAKIIDILNCTGTRIKFGVEHSSGKIRDTPAFPYLDSKEISFVDVSSGHISAVVISADLWNGWRGLEWQVCKVFTVFPRKARVCYKVTGTIFGVNCDQEVDCRERSCF
jgi:hypothetical protein